MKSLGKKILLIMNEVKFIPKSGFNEEQNYAFAKEADVVAKLREAMIKHGVCFLTSVKNTKIEAVRSGGYLAVVDIEVTLLDTDTGETYVAGYTGTGIDFGDKAVYMATTGAEKYALLKIFLLETGDDPENAKGKNPAPAQEAKAPAAEPAKAAKPEQAAKQTPVSADTSTATADTAAPNSEKGNDTPEDQTKGTPDGSNDMEQIVTSLETAGFSRVEDDKNLKGTTYMIANGAIVCRAFRRSFLEGLGFAWSGEIKAFKRAA